MKQAFAPLALLVTLLGALDAQTFEAADVHVSPKETNPYARGGFLPGGRFELKSATMLDLVATAFALPPEKVYGGPSWLESDRFDIIAKAPPSTPEPERVQMLQSLLAERFRLATHKDTKPLNVFGLTQQRRSPQLKQATESEPPDCQRTIENGPPYFHAYACHNVTMADFAERLRTMDNNSVNDLSVDLTSLKGAWDFNFKFTPRQQLLRAIATGQQPPGTSLFEALDKQLGLKLAAQKYPMPVLAIDSVDRVPTANDPGVGKALPAAPTEFEVAEIKPSAPGAQPSGGFRSGGRIDFQGVSLRDLIGLAWELDDDRIAGGPKWMVSDHFAVVAKAAVVQNQVPVIDTVRAMLRTLLVERFQLATHEEDQPVAVYELVAGKQPKLKEADPGSRTACKFSLGERGSGTATIPLRIYTCQNVTMERFAELIRPAAAAYLDHPVIDMTGLQGGWDFEVGWTGKGMVNAARNRKTDNNEAADPTGSLTVFEAVDKQLGLKLEGGKKHSLPVLVIDHAEPLVQEK